MELIKKSFAERRFHIIVLLGSLFSYALRGAQYNRVVSGDDATLFSHATERQLPWGVLGRYDKLGLFDPFNDYLAVLLRIVARLALVGPETGFTFRVYLIMTTFWAIVTWSIAITIRKFHSLDTALLVALLLCWLPFSNQVFLAQVNTVAWPLALLCIVVSATETFPKHPLIRIGLLSVFSLTALSTGTMIVVIPLIIITLASNPKVLKGFEGLLFAITLVSFCVQWYVYEPRTNAARPIGGEVYRSLISWSPQFIRSQDPASMSVVQLSIICLIPIILFASWLILFLHGLKLNKPRAIAALKMFVVSLVLPLLLISGNGWFNTHYMYIPMALFWISVTLILSTENMFNTSIVQIASLSLVTCYLASVSGVFFVL